MEEVMKMVTLTSTSLSRKIAVDRNDIGKIEPDGEGSMVILKTKDSNGDPIKLSVEESPNQIQPA